MKELISAKGKLIANPLVEFEWVVEQLSRAEVELRY
jgi:hypothetical protein